MSVGDLRQAIDAVDLEILRLLEQRAEIAREIAAAKEREGVPSFYDPERERRVLERIVTAAGGALPPAALRAVFREIMSACLALQMPLAVAYLGPEGTYSHVAARRLFGQAAALRDTATIEGVFDAVARGDAARGVVPVENSTEGSVAATARALLEGDLKIEREFVLEIAHALLTRAPSLPAVARVYSHPQALGQCAQWLRKNLPDAELIQRPSTAAAARDAIGDPEGAALGHRLAGELYALPVLVEGVQDRADNATRFVVVAPSDAARTGDDKTTVAFAVDDAPGALRRALAVFEEEGVSLTRIESHPSRERPWGYVFLCDVAGHRDDGPVARVVERLSNVARWVKMLGSYPWYRA